MKILTADPKKKCTRLKICYKFVTIVNFGYLQYPIIGMDGFWEKALQGFGPYLGYKYPILDQKSVFSKIFTIVTTVY